MTSFELAVRTLYWFYVYSMLGWGLEVIYAAVKERQLVNRGFLCGPVCPIYGCGMVVLLYAVQFLTAQGGEPGLITVFLVGMLLTTTLELVGILMVAGGIVADKKITSAAPGKKTAGSEH